MVAVVEERKSGEADLHNHTIFSDGDLSPTELIEGAQRRRLRAIAVTDHDTISGLGEAFAAAKGLDLELVPGVELSAHTVGREFHLLGLFIDHGCPNLLRIVSLQREARRERARLMVERLQQLGVNIDLEVVSHYAGGGTLGRPHVARAIVASGAVSEVDEAFKRYIGLHGPAYVAKQALGAKKAIDCIHGAGGLAILAHPASTRLSAGFIRELVPQGLDGIETRHPNHHASQETKLEVLAIELGLLTSGGTDYHGPGRGQAQIGDRAISWQRYQRLRDAWSKPSSRQGAAEHDQA